MLGVGPRGIARPSVADELNQSRGRRLAALAALALVALYLMRFAKRTSPNYSSWALALFVAIIVAAAIRPLVGLYCITFLTLMADRGTVVWFPFTKNLSSPESLLYLSDKFTFTPLEVVIGVAFVSWLIGIIGDRDAVVIKGPVFRACAAYTVFVALGFVYGIGTGGDLRVALFEGRAMFILFPVYVLATNLCTARQLQRLIWTALVAVVIQSILALRYLYRLSPAVRAELEDLGEHGAAIHMALLLLFVFVLFMYRAATRTARFGLLLGAVPVFLAFVAAQRRASIVALGCGLGLVLASLWWRHRAKFFVATPLIIIAVTGYTAAFWNSTSDAAFPAQAIKSVLAPDSVSAKDQSSDLYRKNENFDINFTIKAAPVTGLGFGQKFYRPVPLPDISAFEFYEYIPHNSVLWIWIKTGVFGFVAMLSMLGLAVRSGVRSLVRERSPTAAAFAVLGVASVVMFAVFAFVDIAWDPRAMVFLALTMAICTTESPTGLDPVRRRPSGWRVMFRAETRSAQMQEHDRDRRYIEREPVRRH